MRMLIVDDDRMICEGTVRRITNMRFDDVEAVEGAYSGEEALALMAQRRYDAMFTDIRMAEMDGLKLVREAKNINPNLICIVITAFDRFQYAQQAIRLGVEDFLVKPLSEQSMRKHVETVIGKYKGIAARKESQLELEICAQMLSGEIEVDECFRQCGLRPPEENVCMVVWQRPVNREEFPELAGMWRWQPRNGRFMLVKWEGVFERVDSIARRLGCFAGISGCGRNLKRLSEQANAALDFAWAEDVPCAVRWTPQGMGGLSGLRQKLLSQARALNAEGVRRMLEEALRKLPNDRRQEARALVEAVENELAELRAAMGMEKGSGLILKLGMGRQAVLRALVEEIADIRRAGTNPDQLHPVAYAKHYAQTHLYESVDMAVLANRLNLSYAYFSRIFREEAGTTFTRYLLSLRMQEVCRLLLNGEKVVDIAEKLCYQNAANLTRSFTREFGMSPSRWLETQRERKG